MTKLEDKLIASAKKSEQDTPDTNAGQEKTAASKPASKKKPASPNPKRVSKKPGRKTRATSKHGRAAVKKKQPDLHPERVWPD